MTNKEIIENAQRAWEEEVRFLSEAGKQERERWVVREFLKKLSILTSEDDLVSLEQDNDIDVMFRDANFQVKEITEADCRRHAEAKESLRRAKNATQLSHLIPPMIAEDIVWDDVYPLILERAGAVKYPRSSRGKIDLLFYVTRRHAFLNRSAPPAELAHLGWRSISCLFGPHPYVLVVTDDAASFLRDHHDDS
jgi:hypothetical protein